MSVPNRSIKFTYEDYLLFPDDGKRHELIDGEHYVTPSPKTKHQRVTVKLTFLLEQHIRGTRAGHLFVAPMDVLLSETDIVEPDLLFVSAARSEIITEANIQGAPDLVVEILSEGTRKTDEIIKRKLYERFAVAEYWIVDPVLETVKVYHLREQRYVRVSELSTEAGDTLSTPLLPELRIPLAGIFG